MAQIDAKMFGETVVAVLAMILFVLVGVLVLSVIRRRERGGGFPGGPMVRGEVLRDTARRTYANPATRPEAFYRKRRAMRGRS